MAIRSNLNEETKTVLEFCELYIRPDNIVQINIFPGAEIHENEVKIMVQETLKLTNNKPFPVIIFVGEFTSFNKDAREFSASIEGKLACTAEAYVVNNLGHMIVGNAYMRTNKPIKPVGFFYDEKKALEWLLIKV